MEYIRRRRELRQKMRWLKHIGKEINCYNRLKQRMSIQQYRINQLSQGYREIYGENLFKGENV